MDLRSDFPRANQEGFVTTALLILLPLLLSAGLVVAAAGLLLKTDNRLRHLCRHELLRAQDEIANDLHQLLRLNRKAMFLRQQRRLAESMILNPQTRPAGLLLRAAVKARQGPLALEQRSLYLHAKAKSSFAPRWVRRSLADELRKMQSLFSEPRRQEADSISITDLAHQSSLESASFDVTISPPDSETPDYRPSPRFQERQVMRVRWRFRVVALFPAWIRRWIKGSNLRLNSQCAAGLERISVKTGGMEKWRPTLIADKL